MLSNQQSINHIHDIDNIITIIHLQKLHNKWKFLTALARSKKLCKDKRQVNKF